jgi:TonB family protein
MIENQEGAAAAAKAAPTAYKPDWLRKPTGQDVAAFFPKEAGRRGVSGTATIACKVVADGRLGDCEVIKERPAGLGFGEAALGLSKTFRMTPPPPGQIGEQSVSIPFTFQAPRMATAQDGAPRYKPQWLRRPTEDELNAYYPEKAQDREIGGSARLTCKVVEGGKLSGCMVTEETPVGLGFGEAALKLSKIFRMTPPPPGATGEVTIPITFSVPPSLESRFFDGEWREGPAGVAAVIVVSLALILGGLVLARALRGDRRVDL